MRIRLMRRGKRDHRPAQTRKGIPSVTTSDRDYTVWKRELTSEVAFWQSWIGEADIPWQEERRTRLDPAMPLQDSMRAVAATPPGGTVRLLDVGAGPATSLGKTWPDRTVEIVAVDPLADEYNRMLDAYGVVVPVRTRQCDGEHLLDVIERATFDIAYSRNALDHSYDPLAVIQAMVEAVKPGGWVILEHYANEAESEQYQGLHQWNFCQQDGQFVIWNRQRRIVVDERLPLASTIKTRQFATEPRNSLTVRIQRAETA